MKYIFFGTPEFAKIVLEKLISAGMLPVAVVTNPDRPAGRKKLLTAGAVKSLILNFKFQISNLRKVDILQPETLEDPAFAQQIESYNADVFVLAAYGKILPKWLVEMPPRGIIGVHPSPLPKYRGATPIQNAILAGEESTGTTLFVMDEKVDHGAIIANCKLQIANYDAYQTLMEKLAEISGDLLVKTLPKYLAGKIAPHPQNHKEATYTKKFTTEDGFVSIESLGGAEGDVAILIHRKIRALNPEPGVFTINKKNKRVKLLEADLVDGKLVLKKIQEEGKKPVTIKKPR